MNPGSANGNPLCPISRHQAVRPPFQPRQRQNIDLQFFIIYAIFTQRLSGWLPYLLLLLLAYLTIGLVRVNRPSKPWLTSIPRRRQSQDLPAQTRQLNHPQHHQHRQAKIRSTSSRARSQNGGVRDSPPISINALFLESLTRTASRSRLHHSRLQPRRHYLRDCRLSAGLDCATKGSCPEDQRFQETR